MLRWNIKNVSKLPFRMVGVEIHVWPKQNSKLFKAPQDMITHWNEKYHSLVENTTNNSSIKFILQECVQNTFVDCNWFPIIICYTWYSIVYQWANQFTDTESIELKFLCNLRKLVKLEMEGRSIYMWSNAMKVMLTTMGENWPYHWWFIGSAALRNHTC